MTFRVGKLPVKTLKTVYVSKLSGVGQDDGDSQGSTTKTRQSGRWRRVEERWCS